MTTKDSETIHELTNDDLVEIRGGESIVQPAGISPPIGGWFPIKSPIDDKKIEK